MCLADHIHAGDAQLAAQIEQVMLDTDQGGANGFRQVFDKQNTQPRVEFVHFAHGVDAQAVLGDTTAVAKAGGAGITGTSNYFREAVAHKCVPDENVKPSD